MMNDSDGYLVLSSLCDGRLFCQMTVHRLKTMFSSVCMSEKYGTQELVIT